MADSATYEECLKHLRDYVEGQKECGCPATAKDLREYRQWKNMPQDAEFDSQLLKEINAEEGN